MVFILFLRCFLCGLHRKCTYLYWILRYHIFDSSSTDVIFAKKNR